MHKTIIWGEGGGTGGHFYQQIGSQNQFLDSCQKNNQNKGGIKPIGKVVNLIEYKIKEFERGSGLLFNFVDEIYRQGLLL